MVRRKTKKIKVEKAILDAYLKIDNHTSFSSAEIIFNFLKTKYKKLKLSQVKNILKGIDSYTLYKNVKHRHTRAKIIAVGKFTHLQMDLADMNRYATDNENYRYILFVIDIFTRVLHCELLRKKDTLSVLKSFKIFAEKYKKYFVECRTLSSDYGGEFRSRQFKSYLTNLGIYQQFLGNHPTKGPYVERCISQVKQKISRYLFQNNTRKYIDVLDQIVQNYNRTYNRVLHMTPFEALRSKEANLWCELYLPKVKKVISNRPFKFKLDETDRISANVGLFKKISDQTFTEEIFKVTKRYRIGNVCYYQLSDLNGEHVIGSFTNSELAKIKYDEHGFFPIEKVHRRKKIGNKFHYLVSFRGYKNQYFWVTDIKDI